jgi:PAS domain S-box-containing protein
MNEEKNADSRPSRASDLRREAEQRLGAGSATPVEGMAEVDVRAMLHELQVHQIELEMQNEELQRAEAAAHEASERYYDLFDFAPVAYFVWDHEGRIREVNLAGAALLGLDRSAASQKRFGQFVAAEFRDTFADFLARVWATDAKQTCEVKLQKEGSFVWVLVEGIAAQDRQGPPRLCRAAVIDITQQKRADELAAANEALKAEIAARKQAEQGLRSAKASAECAKTAAEEANRAKDHFLAALSHELRTPLTPVVMGVSMLQDRHDLDPAAREALEMVRRNVEMETRLIDDLLDVARIARGKIELTRRPVELSTIIDRAVEVCKPDIDARGLEFGVDLGPAAPYWVEADAVRLQQVFWNLLENAIKFTPHGGCIGIRCRPHEDHVLAEVSDSGIGVEPEALPRIFKAFEQAERPTARQFGGLGLGLAISKTLVEMHGGTLSVHSDGRNQGATFRVRLPLCAPAGRSDAPASAPPERRVARPLLILLVDDHRVTAKMMRMVLTEAGHSVETAGDVATALALASQGSFDLLLSDLGLPDGSGHDLLRELRSRGHTFPAIALSGYGQEDDIRRSREAGFAIHLTKPASQEAVVEAIASATSHRTDSCPSE